MTGPRTGWNKHTIKRILGNRRYAGEEPYPAMIDQKQFDRVQDLITQKGTRRGYQQNPRINLWTYMQCEKCGQRLVHGKRLPNGKNYFKCPECGVIIRIAHKDLTRNIVSQINGSQSGRRNLQVVAGGDPSGDTDQPSAGFGNRRHRSSDQPDPLRDHGAVQVLRLRFRNRAIRRYIRHRSQTVQRYRIRCHPHDRGQYIRQVQVRREAKP